MKKVTKLFVLALALEVICCSGVGFATERRAPGPFGANTTGRIAVGAYHVSDDSAANSYDVKHLYYKIVSKKLFGAENVSLNLNGRARQSGYDYQSGIPNNRLTEANVQIENIYEHFDLRVGRSFIEQFPSQSVDGVDLKYWLDEESGFGVFGGARPDPYFDELNLDYTTMGGYVFARTENFGMATGYANDSYKGKKDRERANAVFYFMPATQTFHLQASVEADNDSDAEEGDGGSEDGWSITNMLIHGNFRPTRALLFSFTYSEFRAINRNASFEHVWGEDFLSEQRYYIERVAVEIRPTKNYAFYGGGDLRHRELDDQDATQYYVGVRSRSFFWDTRWDVRYSNLDWFTSKVKSLYGSVGVTKGSFDTDASVIFMTNTQDDQLGDLNQTVYDLRVNYWISSNVYATLMVSYSTEKYLDINSIYASRFADNYTTTTLYGQVGYRF